MLIMGLFYTAVFFVLGAFGRVWFGSDLENKILGNRGLQTVYMMLLFVLCFYRANMTWIEWVLIIPPVCWLQFQFWSRGHGCCFDIGRDEQPDCATLLRYNERWYHIPCDWLFEKVFKRPEEKWGYLYDLMYMTLRYTCPMVALSVYLWVLSWFGFYNAEWRFVWVGFSISFIYAFSVSMEELEFWIFEKKTWWWRRGWSLAEILSGGVVYSSCYLLGDILR